MDLHPPVPRDLRNGIGKLLQPGLVGAATVVQSDGREHDEGGELERRACRTSYEPLDVRAQANRLGGSVGVDAAVLQRIVPEIVEGATAAVPGMQRLPAALEILLEGTALAARL